MKVKSESEVAQSCLTLSDPRDCSPLGSSIHGIFQARVLEWGAIAFSIVGHKQPQMNEYDLRALVCGLTQVDQYIYLNFSLIFKKNRLVKEFRQFF